MMKVAAISIVPKENLILPSNEVNAGNIADKSLSRTTVQPVGQSKASTNKRSKKKKNVYSSNPKTSKIVRESQPKKQVIETQHAKKLVATTDATKSLEAFGSVEELRNQPKPVDIEKEHEKTIKEVVEDPLANESGIGSLGNVNFDELFRNRDMNEYAEESPFDTEPEIKFIRKIDSKEANSDLESMSDDEIMFVSRNEEEDDDFEKLSQVDEIAVENVIDKLVGMANTKDATTNVSIAYDLHVSIVYASSSAPAHTSVVRDTLPTFKKQIQKAINKKMPKVVLKPLYIDFNALNKLESERFVILQKQLSKLIKKTVAKAVKKNASLEKIAADLHELVGLVSQLVRIVDLVAPPISAATEGEKESQAQAQSELEPAMEVPASSQGSGSSEFSPTPPPRGGLTPTLLNLHQFRIAGEGPLTLEEAKLQMQEIKRLADLKAKKEKSEKKLKKLMKRKELIAQEKELAAYKAKRAKMMEEYNHCITFKDCNTPPNVHWILQRN
ncbi:hypothetical protein Tco_1560951 [Tanacetum coccineum]